MMGKRRILAAVLAAAVATAGVVRVAVFYRSGQGFEPFATDRALQNNQVLFPGEDTAAGDGKQGSEENDSFWKEKNAEDAAASDRGICSGVTGSCRRVWRPTAC